MSKQVDERVVSMQFDNKNFEKNVSTTMSTLDKFKQKLNLKGASKGLEEVNAAAKKVDMNGLANGVETVRTKFSAMEVIGVTALANITNSAVNAGKRIVSALTIDPVKTGFQEYETQMDAVQTILANTESKGSTLADVNAALDELNKYADKTIYNFTQMTKNIGTFTAAGVELDTSVSAIQGIANLAAVSGANAQQASTVMYQLSQALAAGKINLMDWNSVVNNSMGGELFQKALIRTSEVMGTGANAAIKKYGTFRESLSKSGWLTAEVLTETLKQISGAYTEADLVAQGFTKAQAKEITKLAETATNAATKVKTFTQLWDVLKESAQSGWSQTWKLIVGDFEQAKALLTPLADFLTGIVNRMSDFRNKIVALVMGNPLAELIKKISGMTDTVKGAMKPLKDYADIVDRIIRGEFGNQGDKGDRNYRKKLVEAAGYDYAVAQTLVNEKLGCSLRLTDDLSEAMGKQNKTQAKTIEQLAEMSDAQLKSLGYTDEQISALRQLAKYAKEAGVPLSEFIENVDQMDGRTMIIETFKNAGKGLVTVCNAIKDAWLKVFPVSVESIAMRIYGAIMKLYNFSKRWDISKDTDTIDKLTRTFKGLFAILDIIRIVVGGPISLVFKLLGKILASLNIPILDVTAAIGDALWAFDQWLFKNNFIVKGLTKCASVIKTWVQQFLAMPEVQQAIEKVKQKFVELWEYLQTKFSGGKDFLSGLVKQVQNGELRIGEAIHIVLKKIGSFGQKFFDKAVEIGKNIIDGISKGLSDKKDSVLEKIKGVGESLITFVKDILGIHSPSTEFIEIGKNIMAGLIVGIGSIKILSVVSNIAKAIGGLGSVLDGVGEVLSGVGAVLVKSAGAIRRVLNASAKVVRKFAKVLGSVGNLINAKALQSVAIAIAILAGSVAVLAMMDPGRVWSAVGVIVVLAGVLGGLMAAVNKFGMSGPAGIKEAISGVKMFGQLASSLLMISGSLLMLAVSLRIIGSMEWSEFGVAAAGIVLLGLVLAGLMRMTKYSGERLYMLRETILALGGAMLMLAVAMRVMGGMEWSEFGVAAAGIVLLGVVVSGLIWATKLAGPFAGTIGKTMLQISGAMLILGITLRILGGMEWSEMGVAAVGLAGLVVVVKMLIKAVNLAGPNADTIGKTLLSIAGAMLILTITAKIIAGMEWTDIGKAAVGLAGLVVIIRMLIKAVQLAGPNVAAIGKTLLAISGAMLILTITAKIIAGMEWTDIGKAAVGLAGLVVIIRMMIQAVKLMGSDAPKIALTLLAMSAAIGILAGIAVLLSLVEVGALVKGIAAVGALALLMRGLITATRGAQDCMKNLIVMTVAIAIMATAIGVLSIVDPTRLAGAAVALGSLMAIFGMLTVIVGSSKTSIGPLIAMTAAISVLAAVLYVLAQLPAESLKAASIAIIAIAGAMLLMAVAVKLIGPMIVTLQGFGIAVAALGIAVLAAGAGILLFAKGFAVFATAVQNGGGAVLGFIVQLVSLLPFFATQIGLALVALFTSIANSASALSEALTIMVLAAIDALVTIIPAIAEGALKLIVGLLESLVEYLPQIVPLLVTLFVTLIDLVVEHLPAITGAIFRLIAAVLDVIASNVSQIISPLVKLFGAIFEGIAAVIGPVVESVIAPLLEVVLNCFVKLFEVLEPHIPMICELIGFLTQTITNAIVRIFEILAPYIPEVTRIVEIIANAVTQIIDDIVRLFEQISPILDSIADIISKTGEAINDALSGVADIINSIGGVIKTWFDGVSGVIDSVGIAALNAGTGFEKLANGIKIIVGLKLTDLAASLAAVATGLGKIKKHSKGIAETGTGMKQIADSVTISVLGFDRMNSGLMSITQNLSSLGPVATNTMMQFTTELNKSIPVIDSIKNRVSVATSSIITSITAMGSACVTTVRGFKNEMLYAGKYMVSGLTSGILAGKPSAVRAAREVASAVETIIRSAWQVNSPSKLFYRIALGVGEGIENAFGDSVYGVKSSAGELADTASNGFGNAIQKIVDFINSDMDTQPTIRPVLDLSDVQSGASTLNGMFSGNRVLAISAPNVGAIAASMSGRQNGNGDLISAINKLAKSNGKSGDTYQINGINYSEGSDVADAIHTLVRAAKMEGRT